MTVTRNIAVAIDGSKYSSYALMWALQYIIRPQSDVIHLIGVSSEKNSQEIKKILGEHEESIAKMNKDDIKFQTNVVLIENQDPREAIVKFCQDTKIDLLVMGSRGLGLIKRMFLGSVSEYCIRNCNCPIAIARDPNPEA